MDIEYVKSIIAMAENRNRNYLSEADSSEDAIDIAEEYLKLLYRDEEIFEIIQQLDKNLGVVPNGIWTPSGEAFNIYVSKCYQLAKKEDFIPAVYHFPVFSEWADQIIESLNTSNPDTNDLILRSNVNINKQESFVTEIDKAFPSHSTEDWCEKLFQGKKLLQNGEFLKAYNLLSETLINNPENEDLNFTLGICSLMLKKNRLALDYFVDAAQYSKDWNDSDKIKILPEILRLVLNPKKHSHLFNKLFKNYLDQNIIEAFKPGLEIDLIFIKSLNKILANQLASFDKSRSYSGRPDSARKFYYYASYLYSIHDLTFDFIVVARNFYFRENLALKRFNKYKFDIYDSVILQAMGVFLNQAKLYNESKYFFIQSILIEANNHQSYQGLGDAFRYTNDFSIAIKHYEKCLEILSLDKKIKGIDIGNEETFKAEYYYCLSMSYQGLKENEKASKYFLKAKELPNNYYFGFIHDGIKDWDDLFKRISELKKVSRDKESFSEEITCTVVNNIHDQLLELLKKFNVKDFGKQLFEKFDFVENLAINGKACFETAEFLFFISPHSLPDYSHVMVEYCKIVEIELIEKFISKLSNWTEINHKKVTTGKNIHEDINRFEKITLGNYPFLFKEKNVKEFISEIYNDETKDFVIEKLGKNINEIIKLRNDSAHLHTCSFEKVLRLRALLLDNGILKGISKL